MGGDERVEGGGLARPHPDRRGGSKVGWRLSFNPSRARGHNLDLSLYPGTWERTHPLRSLKEPECRERLPEGRQTQV